MLYWNIIWGITRRVSYEYNMGIKPILLNLSKVRFQIDGFVFQAQIAANVVPVKIDRAGRQPHQCRNFLCGFSLAYKVSDLALSRREPCHSHGKPLRQGEDDIIQVRFNYNPFRLLSWNPSG